MQSGHGGAVPLQSNSLPAILQKYFFLTFRELVPEIS
jgi:hypothetical protein